MLRNIRKMANSITTRILLGVVVIAFIVFGIKDVLQTTNNLNLVTFSSGKNITEQDFAKAKSEEIAIIQKQNNINLTDEDIKELEIDQIILQRLINNNILNYITQYYELDLSEKTIIQFIKQAPIFTNSYGEFDLQIFHSVIRNSYQKEEEYLQRLKEEILKSALLNIFSETFDVPKTMIVNVINYLSEKRNVDLVQIDLDNTNNMFVYPAVTKDELEKFYNNNQALFTIPEMRNLSYVTFPSSMIKQKIKVTDEELMDFYQNNIDEFDNKNFDKVKQQVAIGLKKQKFEELQIEFNKNLEDAVASGSSLKEIAEKYDLSLQHMNSVTYSRITSSKTIFPQDISDHIFEMAIGEVSYPIETNNDGELLLVEVSAVSPSVLESFAVAEGNVEKLWKLQWLRRFNLDKFNMIAKTYDSRSTDLQQLKKLGATVNSKYSIIREDLRSDNESSHHHELDNIIFQTKVGSNTPVFTKNNKAYFAYIKSISIDNTRANTNKQSNSGNIANNIRQGIIEEMVQYFGQQNNMKIHKRN